MKKYRVQITGFFIMLGLCLIFKPDRPTSPDYNFPVPDPNKGWATGFDFDKGDYRYHTDYDGTKWKPGQPIRKQSANRQRIKSSSREDSLLNKVYDLDIEDILEYAY